MFIYIKYSHVLKTCSPMPNDFFLGILFFVCTNITIFIMDIKKFTFSYIDIHVFLKIYHGYTYVVATISNLLSA
jgi:hypothetical protein